MKDEDTSSGSPESTEVAATGATNLDRLLARVRQTGGLPERPRTSSNEDKGTSLRDQWESLPDRVLRRVDFPWFLRQQ